MEFGWVDLDKGWKHIEDVLVNCIHSNDQLVKGYEDYELTDCF